jgi:phage terminase large subunit
MFQTTQLFDENLLAKTKIIVNQGGTWSSKTYSILQLLSYIAVSEPNVLISVVGQDIPNLKRGALRDFQNIYGDTPQIESQIFNYNKSERTYHFYNGSIIEFMSYENAQDAKSGKRDYLFINEANGIDYSIAKQLIIRTKKRVFIDYNPDAEFWVHEKFLNNPTATFLYSDYRNNPFVPQSIIDEIEDLKNIDIELWKIYARGVTGRIEGLIYRHWHQTKEFPMDVPYVYGLDFGYNHPTALIKCGWSDEKYFVEEVIYQSGLTTAQLIEQMKKLNIGTTEIFADSARPDTIEEISSHGFNVFNSDKSVKDGINCIKSKPLMVINSPNLTKELRTYKWKVDKNGKPLDEPVKFNDDGMDAMRYGIYNGLKQANKKVTWF